MNLPFACNLFLYPISDFIISLCSFAVTVDGAQRAELTVVKDTGDQVVSEPQKRDAKILDQRDDRVGADPDAAGVFTIHADPPDYK